MDVGRGDRIRTCDPLLPKQMRYQTALLPDDGCHLEVIIPLANPPGLAALDDHRDWHVGDMPQSKWWARQDSNLQPSRYERPALPLSYRPSPARSR